jgi:hypothetical protein
MAKPDEPYHWIDVESYEPLYTSGLHGPVHVRPLPGQQFGTHLQVECSRKLVRNYPVGTKFRIRAKLTDREGSGPYLYSHFKWKYYVLSDELREKS